MGSCFPDFLRLSRSTIDDSIAQNLNALVTPAKKGFDPSSTSVRQTRPDSIDPDACNRFKDNVLFPSWQSRSDVLDYCEQVAASPDPDDADLLSREAASVRDRDKVVDERLDPYSSRPSLSMRETRTQTLENLVRNERAVEGIIRIRSFTSVTERCGSSSANWEEALNSWRKRQGR